MPAIYSSHFSTGYVHRQSHVNSGPLRTTKKPYARPEPLVRQKPWSLPTITRSLTTSMAPPIGSYALRIRNQMLEISSEFEVLGNVERRIRDRQRWQEDTQDHRHRIPLQKERINLGRKLNHPRRILQDRYPSIKERTGVDASVTRWRLGDSGYAMEAWDAVGKATWSSSSALLDHGHVTVAGVPLKTTPMPTHLANISQDTEGQQSCSIVVPVHSKILRSSWSRLKELPSDGLMDLGANTPCRGYAQGDLPFVHLPVDNVRTFGPLLTYTYLRDDSELLQALLGPSAAKLASYVGIPVSLGQRDIEWAMSMEFGATHSHSDLHSVLLYINDLAENGNCVGMEGTHFWWILSTCLRIVNDAIIAKYRFEPSQSAGPVTDGYAADTSESEREILSKADIVKASVYKEKSHAAHHTTSRIHKKLTRSRTEPVRVKKPKPVPTKGKRQVEANFHSDINVLQWSELLRGGSSFCSDFEETPPDSGSDGSLGVSNQSTHSDTSTS